MNWLSLVVGWLLGCFASLAVVWVQRSWSKKDERTFNKKVMEALIIEIEQAIERCEYLIQCQEEQRVSFSRLYLALWQSVNQRFASTVDEADVLVVLHRIYHRFDLINFNFEKDRPGSANVFAEQYLPEIKENLATLKKVVEVRQ